MRHAPLVLMSVVFAACGEPPAAGASLKVAQLSKDAITVGETLYMSGTGFLAPSEGKTLVEFTGVFYWTDDDGNLVPEDVPPLTIAPVYDGAFPDGGSVGGMDVAIGAGVLRWNRFGPYEAPFGGSGRRVGLFKGTATAINVSLEGDLQRGESTDVAIEVKPSLLITRLEPVLGESDAGDIECWAACPMCSRSRPWALRRRTFCTRSQTSMAAATS